MTHLESMLIRQECDDFFNHDKHVPYYDSKHILSIDIGINLQEGLSSDECLLIFRNRLPNYIKDLANNLPWFSMLDEVRQDALTNMCYNMGIQRLLGFHNMLTAFSQGNYDEAAKECLDSQAARDLPARYTEIANMIKTGEYTNVT